MFCRESKLKIALDEKNKANQQLADLVGGADILQRLINVASTTATATTKTTRRDDDDENENE